MRCDFDYGEDAQRSSPNPAATGSSDARGCGADVVGNDDDDDDASAPRPPWLLPGCRARGNVDPVVTGPWYRMRSRW